MRKFFLWIIWVCLIVLGSGCACVKARLPWVGSGIRQSLGDYNGLKAKVSVSEFEIKTSAVTKETADVLRDIFIANLNQSKRFSVCNASEADLIIEMAITDFVPEPAGGKSGVAGGGSSGSFFMGGLLEAGVNKASMGWDARIITREKGEVISKKSIRFQSQEQLREKEKDFFKGFTSKEEFSKFRNAPMGKVIYNCIIESVRYLAQNIPLDYYKY